MIRTKEQILDVLEKAYEHSQYVIFGEQCATKQKPNDLIANYAEKSGGHKPAILGIDLGCYGFRLTTIGEGSPEWKEKVLDKRKGIVYNILREFCKRPLTQVHGDVLKRPKRRPC